MANLPAFKRGDTWSLTCFYRRGTDKVDLTNIDVYSQIRDSKMNLISDLVVTKADQNINKGGFTLTPKDPKTDTWALGNLLCDIEFVMGDIKISTETFTQPVVEQITKIGE